MLRLDGVSRRFGGLLAVDTLTLDITAGSRHAIIGPNGAGKSTLLNLIAGTIRPTTGRIWLGDTNITRFSPDRRARRGMARTFQHPAVIDTLGIADNLALAVASNRSRTSSIDRPVRAIDVELVRLRRAGLTAPPATLAADLPYGQRRLLEISVALAGHPSLLLLDEPSAGLDTAALATLSALLRELGSNITVVLVDHHLDLVFDIADTVTVLDHGQHLITGPPVEVRTDTAVRATYLAPPTATPGTRRKPRTDPAGQSPALSVESLRVGYHDAAPVLAGINLEVAAGTVAAVVGRNGSGKTTLVNTIAGLHPPALAASVNGSIRVAGTTVAAGDPRAVNDAGVAVVPQGRRLFTGLTVAEHLIVADWANRRGPDELRGTYRRDRVLDLFPHLAARLSTPAGRLSGGEQQMLAIARALLTQPAVLVLDEPVEGLAPMVVDDITSVLAGLADDGVAVVFTDSHLGPVVTALADQVYLLLDGALSAPRGGNQVREDPAVLNDLVAALSPATGRTPADTGGTR